MWVDGLVFSGEICKSFTKGLEEVEGCDGGGREVAVVGGSKGGTNREIEEKKSKEEK